MLLQSEGGAKPRVETAKAARNLGTGVFKFCMLLVGRFPTENSHRNAVRTAQITFHLLLKICKRVETQMVVEALLIISVASLDLAIVPWCSRTNELVFNLVAVTKHIKRMNALGIEEMSKFCAIVRLYGFRGISKESNGTLYKVNCRIAAVLLVSIDKTLS